MILTPEQANTEWHFFLSEGSICAGKNELLSRFTCLQCHFYIKYKRWKYNQ